jgi:hypothetical protein
MEKVKQTRQTSKIHWRISERLCEGLKLQQLGDSNKFIKGLIFFMQVSKCVCRSQGPSKGSL